MSPSPSASTATGTSGLPLEIEAADLSTEIFVVDGGLQLVGRGVGKLSLTLPPGIYKLKSRAGDETREEHVMLVPPGLTRWLPPFEFLSPAPLRDTSATHEYHVDAAEKQSRTVHVHAGSGSFLFVFAREFTRTDTGSPDGRLANPAVGLSLCSPDGEEIVNFEHQAVVDSSVRDPWAACNVEIDPGVYLLRTVSPDGSRFEQAIVTSAGWQSQVFVLPRATSAGRGPDTANAAILMPRAMGFDSADKRLRREELARLALANRRKVASEEIRELLRGKIDDPLLGMFSAHLVLLDTAPAVYGRSGEVVSAAREPDLELVRTVVDSLRSLVGSQHPDVEALALASGLETRHLFDSPPMLRRSWNFILNATVQHPNLVPPDSLAARAGRSSWSDQPWLVWNADMPQADAIEAAFEAQIAAASAPYDPLAMESPFAAIRRKREKLHKVVDRVSKVMPPPVQEAIERIQSASSTAADLAEKKITLLVKTLGMPRSNIERMLSKRGTSMSNNDSNQDHWCFAWPVARQSESGQDRAALVKAAKWNVGDVISVSFLDGDPVVQERVKKAALGWLGPKLADLTFDFRKSTTDTLIRISFKFSGSWSVIGTTCKQVTDKKQPTMNFGWLKPDSPESDLQRVVLHEFGHALGLIHEHQNPAGGIKWNRDAVIRDLSGPPNNWPLSVIEHNMFEPQKAAETNFTKVDSSSIMMYPIPSAWTLDGFSAGLNTALSDTDRKFIHQQYS